MTPDQYVKQAKETSVFDWKTNNGKIIPILGLLGELGSLATVVKRHLRDEKAYAHAKLHMKEELADLLWYVMIIGDYFGVSFTQWPNNPRSSSTKFVEIINQLQKHVFDINRFTICEKREQKLEQSFNSILDLLSEVASKIGTNLASIAEFSVHKTTTHWKEYEGEPAHCFDANYPEHEQLVRKFTIHFKTIRNLKSGQNSLLLSMNGVHIGDRLTDNNEIEDGYRFHDVFHLMGACCLGWSPVFRRMLKLKRKSDSKVDEVQDGARAAILEEAIVGQIFSYARELNFLEGMKRVDTDLIKLIQSNVQHLEVSEIEAWEWQHYIKQSYNLFREIKNCDSGKIVFDADKRSYSLNVIK